MRIEGRHTFKKSRSAVWGALQDPETLAATLPGVQRLEVVGPDRYSISARVGVGSVKGMFDGTFEVADKKELESCTLLGSARGSSGSTELEARVILAEADGTGTLLTYSAEASVAGPIAGVGQRMIQAASKRMAQQFFDAVDGYDRDAHARVAVEADGRVFTRPPAEPAEWTRFAAGVAVGFALALIGVAVGRRTAR